MKNTTWTFSAVAVAAALTLTSCADDGSEEADSESPQHETAQSGAAQAESGDNARIQSSQEDLWARAADSEMTSVFGTIENLTDEDLTVVAATTDAAGMTELHEIVQDEDGQQLMQEIEGGFTIPASGALELETGGDHLMLMDLQHELLPGDVLEISLEFEDGTQESIEAMVRDDGGQDEPYDHGDDMDHEDDTGSDHDSDDHEH